MDIKKEMFQKENETSRQEEQGEETPLEEEQGETQNYAI